MKTAATAHETGQGPRVAWYVPSLNERRAGLRYRCLYPMEALRHRGVDATLTHPAAPGHADVVVYDGWSLFPSISDDAAVAALLAHEQAARARGATIVLDNCDNQFAGTPDVAWQHACRELTALARRADLVVTCSTALAAVMQQHCRLPALPTVIDDPIETRIRYRGDRLWRALLSPGRLRAWLRLLRHRATLAAERARGMTPLVWFGSHGNGFAPGGMLDVQRTLPALTALCADRPLSLTIISNNRSKFDGCFAALPFPTHYLDWDRVTFLAALRSHAIALLPVTLNDFTRCKSANRLALALAHGLGVVGDVIPSFEPYRAVVNLGDWEGGLRRYLDDPALLAQDVCRGRELAQDRGAAAVIGEQWLTALTHARRQRSAGVRTVELAATVSGQKPPV